MLCGFLGTLERRFRNQVRGVRRIRSASDDSFFVTIVPTLAIRLPILWKEEDLVEVRYEQLYRGVSCIDWAQHNTLTVMGK